MKVEVGAKSDIVRRRFIMTMNSATFLPDWVSPPGETILDLMNEKAWTQVELAQKLGYTLKQLKLLIEGKVSLTEGINRPISFRTQPPKYIYPHTRYRAI